MLLVIRLFLATIGLAMMAVVPVRAGTVFTNIQSDGAGGCDISGSNFGGVTVACAAAFTPSANYIMTDAQFKVLAGPGAGSFDVFLYSNSSGLPGSSLGMIGSGTAPRDVPGIVTVNSPALSLVSGTEYWLVMAPQDSGSAIVWNDGGIPTPPAASDRGFPSSNWVATSDSEQFQVDGTLVAPEPATFGLVVAGILLAVARRRKKSSGSPAAG